MSRKNKHKLWVGFDLGGTKMMATVFDEDLHKRGSVRKKTKAQEGVKAGLARMTDVIEAALAEKGDSRRDLGGIGIGCPGPLDLKKGILKETANLGWSDVPLRKYLEKRFKCPVVVMNDVDAGVYGEYRKGAARKARCVVGVFPGTGIGGGCVYDGRVITGKRSTCFEIGHMCVVPNGIRCGCGNCGCLETVASRMAIASQAAAAAFRGSAPHLLAACGTDVSEIRSNAIAAAIRAGDDAVEDIVRQAASWLGIGISITVNLMAPDVVLLGGGLVEAMPKIYREEVKKELGRHVMASLQDSFEVVISKLGDDAVATGAASWAMEEVESAKRD